MCLLAIIILNIGISIDRCIRELVILSQLIFFQVRAIELRCLLMNLIRMFYAKFTSY